jgi:hypothetical protein
MTPPYGLRVASGTSAGGASVAVTIAAAGVGSRHYLWSVVASYSATPTGGGLTTTGLVGDEIALDIATAVPVAVQLNGVPCDLNTALVVTLAAPGGAVVGKVNVFYVTRTP